MLEAQCIINTGSSVKWAETWQNQQNECAPSEDSSARASAQSSLIRVFVVHMKKAWAFTYPLSAQRSLWSDWADAQDDVSLRWAHTYFVGFVMSWLMVKMPKYNKSHLMRFWHFSSSVLRKVILQTRMRSHPMGLDVWFLVGSVYFHTLCMRTAKAVARRAGSPDPSRVAYVISTIIALAGSIK